MSKNLERRTGFEISEEFEAQRKTMGERLKVDKKEIMAFVKSFLPLFIVFLIGCWLASNPFSNTVRVDSVYNQTNDLVGTNSWSIIPIVVGVGLLFEFLDASAGMGFGTALSPLLMLMGFHPVQVVPAIMIEQTTCGLVGTFLHKEFKNVEWHLRPMSETIKLWLLISGLGCLAVCFSITTVYALFKMHKVWIKLYVLLLLLMMGVIAVIQARAKRSRTYRPKLMTLFGFLAGFNKGIGGGGYGPVVTIGGLLSGVPVKSQLAVTAISEGTVSAFAVIVWFATMSSGLQLDFLLVPSMMIAAIGAGIIAPFAVRVFPEKFWKWLVPTYCLALTAFGLYKIGPEVLAKILGG